MLRCETRKVLTPAGVSVWAARKRRHYMEPYAEQLVYKYLSMNDAYSPSCTGWLIQTVPFKLSPNLVLPCAHEVELTGLHSNGDVKKNSEQINEKNKLFSD